MAIVTSFRQSVPPGQAVPDWQSAMKAAVRDPRQLCQHLKLPMRYQAAAVQAAGQFAVFAPWEYIERMKPGDPHDPLLRQVLPLQEELDSVPGFEPDPLREQAPAGHPGLLQKYSAGRC